MPKKIYQDGKAYTFEPGRNGSLTANPKDPNSFQYKPHPEVLEMPKQRAKTIGPKKQVQVGSARG